MKSQSSGGLDPYLKIPKVLKSKVQMPSLANTPSTAQPPGNLQHSIWPVCQAAFAPCACSIHPSRSCWRTTASEKPPAFPPKRELLFPWALKSILM